MLHVAIYGFVIEGVCQVMFRLIRLFCWAYSKNVDVKDFDLMRKEFTIDMSLLEMFFLIIRFISSSLS
jgi:hypothetical protein